MREGGGNRRGKSLVRLDGNTLGLCNCSLFSQLSFWRCISSSFVCGRVENDLFIAANLSQLILKVTIRKSSVSVGVCVCVCVCVYRERQTPPLAVFSRW